MVARGWGCGPSIDEPMSLGDPQRATIKTHLPSTQPLSPLRNPRLGFRLMPITAASLTPIRILPVILSAAKDLPRWNFLTISTKTLKHTICMLIQAHYGAEYLRQ